MAVIITRVESVKPHGDNLSIVTVDGNEVVANRDEKGDFRWSMGEVCAYVPENSIVPEDVLKERHYWQEGAKKGDLGGSKGNRVKMQRFAGHESRGLLFKVVPGPSGYWIERDGVTLAVEIGQDVTEFLGVTDYVAA